MSNKVKKSSSVNEKILKECHQLYTDVDLGLIKIAKDLGKTLLAPRKKVSIVLLGNHSAGKSSFINWYIEEHIQKTGVAIETQGFSLVTSGKKRETLTGTATLHLYPHLSQLREFEGVVTNLKCEISTSRTKNFNLVTFIDTPGLVDGNMTYPFDVNATIDWLGDASDMIFVFFDPIGQALCKRTLNLIEGLSERHSNRMRYFLSKADEAGTDTDRQRVMCQIIQEMCKRQALNRTALDMKSIYIPCFSKSTRNFNQIEEVTKDIEDTIALTIQNTLNSLESDCLKVIKVIEKKIEKNTLQKEENIAKIIPVTLKFLLFVLIGFLFYAHDTICTFSDMYKDIATRLIYSAKDMYYQFLSSHLQWAVIFIVVGVFLFHALQLFTISSRLHEVLTTKQFFTLTKYRKHVEGTVIKKKQQLYSEYLNECMSEQDM